jgi:glutaminyl-tRNA synthetase
VRIIFANSTIRFIHWVASSPAHSSPISAEVRYFNPLFNSTDPSAHPAGFLADVNPNSLETYPNALLDIGFTEIKRRAPWPAEEGERMATVQKDEYNGTGAGQKSPDSKIFRPETVRFQGMRVAYFALDSDSTEEKVVLNRIVALKDDPGKS